MVRTINPISLELKFGKVQNVRLYAEVNSLNFELVNGVRYLKVFGKYWYYDSDDEATEPIIYGGINKMYTPAEYNALYASLTITETDKDDMVQEEIDKTLPSQIIAEYPNLGLSTSDFEVYVPS